MSSVALVFLPRSPSFFSALRLHRREVGVKAGWTRDLLCSPPTLLFCGSTTRFSEKQGFTGSEPL